MHVIPWGGACSSVCRSVGSRQSVRFMQSCRAVQCSAGQWRSELTQREPDPNKRTNKCNVEAGRDGRAKGKEGGKGEKREERGAKTEKQGEGQEETSASTQKEEEKESSRQSVENSLAQGGIARCGRLGRARTAVELSSVGRPHGRVGGGTEAGKRQCLAEWMGAYGSPVEQSCGAVLWSSPVETTSALGGMTG